MVAEKVQVISKSVFEKNDIATLWESNGEEKYKLQQTTKDTNGTDIIIYLNEENFEFAEEGRIKFLLEKYSQYINFPLNLISEAVLVDENKNKLAINSLFSKSSAVPSFNTSPYSFQKSLYPSNASFFKEIKDSNTLFVTAFFIVSTS